MTEPGLFRRQAVGAPSTRGLLLTLLGEFVLPGDGTAWTSAVLDVLGRLGAEQKATRQALMRTAAAGWLEPEKFGRRTRWRLTCAGRRLLREGADRIYSFSGPRAGWDGRWLLVYVRVPERDRRTRHVVRTRLSWAGFGTLGGGWWISPHPEREREAAVVLRETGVDAESHIFVATRPGLADVATIVGTAWDLAAVEREYARFISDFASEHAGDVLARQIELVHAWRRFPSLDPLLPQELLPRRWSGLKAARIFADRHASWSAEANLEWKRLNETG